MEGYLPAEAADAGPCTQQQKTTGWKPALLRSLLHIRTGMYRLGQLACRPVVGPVDHQDGAIREQHGVGHDPGSGSGLWLPGQAPSASDVQQVAGLRSQREGGCMVKGPPHHQNLQQPMPLAQHLRLMGWPSFRRWP